MALGNILGIGQQQPNILGGGMGQPRIPYGQNQAVTMAALGLIGAPTLNEGMSRAAQMIPAGMAANTANRVDMRNQADKARTRAAMNAAVKLKSKMPLTPEEQAALDAAPEVMLQFGFPDKKDLMAVGSRIYDSTEGKWIDPPAGGGSFEGTALDAQDSNNIIRGQTDPAFRSSPEYALSWSRQFETPKLVAGGTDEQGNQVMRPIMPTIPPGLQGPGTGAPSMAAPGGAPQQMPAPTGGASPQVPGQPRVGDPIITGRTKEPDTIRTQREKVNQSFKAIDEELNRYVELVKQEGVSAIPGQARDKLNTVRQGIMLQLKELFNLGVLNGPDLSLMERMIYDPVVDVTKEGGLTSLPDQLVTGIAGGSLGIASPGDRAEQSANELRRMMENIKRSVANQPGADPPTLPQGGTFDWTPDGGLRPAQ